MVIGFLSLLAYIIYSLIGTTSVDVLCKSRRKQTYFLLAKRHDMYFQILNQVTATNWKKYNINGHKTFLYRIIPRIYRYGRILVFLRWLLLYLHISQFGFFELECFEWECLMYVNISSMKPDTHRLQACKDDRMLIYIHCLLIDGTLNYALYNFFVAVFSQFRPSMIL